MFIAQRVEEEGEGKRNDESPETWGVEEGFPAMAVRGIVMVVDAIALVTALVQEGWGVEAAADCSPQPRVN
nr:hypothetical protein [Candidatus Freyrarchaeum guaymaensis]